MTLYAFLFYFLSAIIVASTAVAVTRRNLVHAVVTLIMSFFGTAMLFYLLGAPLLAALWVIIYAGAIMVLFLFIVMMTRVESTEERMFPLSQWIPTAILGVMVMAVGCIILFASPDSGIPLKTAVATPREFALYVFERHWLSIEIVSLLLLVALIGALHLGRRTSQSEDE
ncbi:MAG: NADH-ubiquinone/plastoquinone oxidoreductase subunit 6, partial [Syntrophobacteraceae bacterium]|nr:NADH-ubiquinone/plastoquinone oxidoreductase subunit 6 [Syntrophobacteraceae bacterium]